MHWETEAPWCHIVIRSNGRPHEQVPAERRSREGLCTQVDPVEQLLEDPLDHSDSCINLFHSTADDGLTEVEQEIGYVKPLPGQRVVSGARVHVPCELRWGDSDLTTRCQSLTKLRARAYRYRSR